MLFYYSAVFLFSAYILVCGKKTFRQTNRVNILLLVHQSCFVAPALEVWGRLFPGHHVLGPGHWGTSASSEEDGSLSSPSAHTVITKVTMCNCWSSIINTDGDVTLLTISRFSFVRLFSFSSSFWMFWVKSSFLLFSSLFLSSRGLHCFSDSLTRFNC